jgi:hypothetical protein
LFRMLIILILSQQGIFATGIETPSGLVQRTFNNDDAGVAQFYEYADRSRRDEDAPYLICMVRHGTGEYGAIGISVVLAGLQPVVLSSPVYDEFVVRTKSDAASPVTAANACAAMSPAFAGKEF